MLWLGLESTQLHNVHYEMLIFHNFEPILWNYYV